MQVTISGPHGEITETLREYVRLKLTRNDRPSSPVIQSHVVLHVTKIRRQVETTVDTKGAPWHPPSEDRDMYLAIDRVVEKLDRQAVKQKGEIVDHYKEGGGLKNRLNT